ncbi:unnamed protein product [Urochloa humidicola]
MDNTGTLAVWFHFGGYFQSIDGLILYVGGDIGMSYIELDKISLPEIKGHLQDHFKADNVVRMHWLQPGKELSNGLVLLVDDVSCQLIADGTSYVEIADIYIEELKVQEMPVQWFPDEEQDCGQEQEQEQGGEECYSSEEEYKVFESDDSSDEEYKQPTDEDCSAEDEEIIELRKFAKEIRRNIKAKKVGLHGSQLGEITENALVLVEEEPINLEDSDSPYCDSSDEYSYEENSEGETERWKSQENRYDSKAPVPVFALGMAFRCSRQFKKALIKYGLKTHRHLNFIKDEKSKVRATCSWEGCNWLIYGSKTNRSEWFKVVTFRDVHTCPPRRDNKLVTSTRIAKHYYNQIKDNPTWKVGLLKQAVLKDFLADVSISKCKRAKSLVLNAALDGVKGEYTRVYDYQAELLRGNPGSTVVVCLNAEFKDRKVFERFYCCFDACKKGFLAGCRRVIGLDGCWFKGANNGQLLCAVGRDANNQMYPIAWAAVATETYESWSWFLGLLQKDLNISNGGEAWVIISDQQKV